MQNRSFISLAGETMEPRLNRWMGLEKGYSYFASSGKCLRGRGDRGPSILKPDAIIYTLGVDHKSLGQQNNKNSNKGLKVYLMLDDRATLGRDTYESSERGPENCRRAQDD